MTAAFAFLFNHLGHDHFYKVQCIAYENKLRVKSRLEAKGFLTLDEANLWYQIGDGNPLTMDAEKLGIEEVLSQIQTNRINSLEYINTFDASIDVGLVYGTISVKFRGVDLQGNNIYQVLPDKYDFDMHRVSNFHELFRNIATKIGNLVAGNGNPFMIYFNNYIRVKK